MTLKLTFPGILELTGAVFLAGIILYLIFAAIAGRAFIKGMNPKPGKKKKK